MRKIVYLIGFLGILIQSIEANGFDITQATLVKEVALDYSFTGSNEIQYYTNMNDESVSKNCSLSIIGEEFALFPIGTKIVVTEAESTIDWDWGYNAYAHVHGLIYFNNTTYQITARCKRKIQIKYSEKKFQKIFKKYLDFHL